ncbi:hypothetical protein Dfri01_52150 [Dyadobacter frigoris]|nr:hypothetical protein Dfri01_52150 [Dyadobacter frigoris]
MLPDGIFEATLGRQQLNAYFSNTGASTQTNLKIYVESTSHPGIIITPSTHTVGSLLAGASSLQSWEVNVGNAPAGKHYISFIAENASGRSRIIKRIFITKVSFNEASNSFSAETPEGIITVTINELWTSKDEYDNCDCKKGGRKYSEKAISQTIINDALSALKKLDINDFKDCPPQTLLIKNISAGIVYSPGFTGQYGELPYQDPWWKTLLAILAAILFIAAFVVAAAFGVVVTGGGAGIAISAVITCCSVPFFAAVGLAVGALTSAILSSALDSRDPFRRGQDNTLPGAGELTIGEALEFEIDYIEPIQLGKPYKIGTKWNYSRITKDSSAVERSYSYEVAETNSNIHVLSKYEIDAPDVVKVYLQKEKPFIVRAKFYDENEKLLRGPQLFVKCFLQRKSDNKIISFMLEDSGNGPDEKASEGTYTGIHYFSRLDDGYWRMYVIAQDVNYADEDMAPDDAAQIIGGQVLTHQLEVNYSGGTCPLVPDGEVHVIG